MSDFGGWRPAGKPLSGSLGQGLGGQIPEGQMGSVWNPTPHGEHVGGDATMYGNIGGRIYPMRGPGNNGKLHIGPNGRILP